MAHITKMSNNNYTQNTLQTHDLPKSFPQPMIDVSSELNQISDSISNSMKIYFDRSNELEEWLGKRVEEQFGSVFQRINSKFEGLVEVFEEKTQIQEEAQEAANLALSIHKCLSDNRSLWSNNENPS